MLLLNICYQDFGILPLIPASVDIQSTSTAEELQAARQHLMALEQIFNDYSPIRSTFSAVAFMLQNPHLMQTFLEASPSHKNSLPLVANSKPIQQQALQLLQQFEAFVGSFNPAAVLQSMGSVSPELAAQGMYRLEELHKILGYDAAFSTFLQALAFGLKLQQSNPPAKQAADPIRNLGGMLLSAKGMLVKNLGMAADTVFESMKDTNDVVQSWTSMLKVIPVLGNAVEPAHQTANNILDGVHMVVGDTVEAVGDTLKIQGNRMLSQQPASFANTRNLKLDQMIAL